MDDFMMDHGDKVSLGCAVLIIFAVLSFIGFVVYAEYEHVTGIKSGYIYQKRYEPASETTTFQTVTTGKTTVTIPVKHKYNESYRLYITITDKDGKRLENYVEVPADVWNKVKVGDWLDGNCLCVVPK